MHVIDLRSDTVTRPTPAMRRAMAEAEVGDDVYGEDPTVNRLQETAAARLGKEAALFLPSGTMANQAAIRASTSHGDVVLATEGAHVLRYESGAAAAISGVQIRTLGTSGMLSVEEVLASIPPKDAHNAPVTLLTLEITHNAAGGCIPPFEAVSAVVAAARERGLRTHLDGARLFNAEVATGTAAREWAGLFDTVSFCLSKGLGAPVGSLVCGTRETIERVHRIRKMLGGGMRQAGILAAAGLHALEHHVERLGEDHENARRLAEALVQAGFRLERPPETNIVFLDVPDAAALVRAARQRGVLLGMAGPKRVRALTHLDVGSGDTLEAGQRLRDFAAELG
ncbi:MAG: low-specificity L-threonine aldolase [Deltaproteobacteria bacterium]|nr:low-specificity L-threonine aldolase [Deltaproteobacteria bacterium]